MWIFFCPFLEALKNLQICGFLRAGFLFAGEVVPRSSCYHINSSRDKPTEPQSLSLSAISRTNKKISKPDSRAGEGYHSRTSQYSDLFAGAGGMRKDHSTYLWNRAFCVSQPCQMVWCLICVLLRYLSLPEVRGKGQNNDEHDDWSSSNQRWSRCDGDP